MAKTVELAKFGKLNDESYKMAQECIFVSISMMSEFSSINKMDLEYCLTNNFIFHPGFKPRVRPFKKSWK